MRAWMPLITNKSAARHAAMQPVMGPRRLRSHGLGVSLVLGAKLGSGEATSTSAGVLRPAWERASHQVAAQP